ALVAEMEAAAGSTRGRETSTLVHSLRRLGVGKEAEKENRCADALSELAEAERDLRSIQSVASMSAIHFQALCQLEQSNYAGARATVTRLGRDFRLADHPSLQARELWLLAN